MIARLSLRHAVARCALAALIALAMIGTSQRASAQAAAPQPVLHQPSPSEILLAKQIMDIKHVRDIFEPLVRGVVIKARDTFMQTNFMWGRDLNEIAVDLQKKFAPRANELVDSAARTYASHFTEAELRQILAFYQSALGQKMLAEEPKALNESMSDADKFADNLSLEVIDSMRAEMKKRGHDI
jgi:uncharacterized protein